MALTITRVTGADTGCDPLMRYVVDEASGCWEWQGAKLKTGYGVTWVGTRPNRSKTTAHRVFYAEHVSPIPEGLEIDHLCRNRGCVNPDHLEVVDHTENMRRGSGTRLSMEDARAIRKSPFSNQELAEQYNISPFTVRGIRAHQRWRETPNSGEQNSAAPVQPTQEGETWH